MVKLTTPLSSEGTWINIGAVAIASHGCGKSDPTRTVAKTHRNVWKENQQNALELQPPKTVRTGKMFAVNA